MNAKIVLLDGGMGQELIARSSQPPSPLWSASVMMNEPEIVEAVHREYIDAGAKVLTLNSYSATPERLERDASADLFEPLQAKAIEIAKRAAQGSDTSIAGCLPPLFGSYHPEDTPDASFYRATYDRIADYQKSAVDVFLCETMSSIKEAASATAAAVATGKPVWCAMSVDDDDGTRLRSGEALEEGVTAAKQAGASAVLINCSTPEAVTQGLPILKACGLPFGAYANGFTRASDLKIGGTVDVLKARTDLSPEVYAEHVMKWIEQGATIVGGCCEVGPAHISKLASVLKNNGYQICGANDV